MKTVRSVKGGSGGMVSNPSSGHTTPQGKHDDDDDEEDDADEEDDECDDPITAATRVMDTCLASHEFEWLTPSSGMPPVTATAINPLEVNTEVAEAHSNPVASAAIPPQPQHKPKKSNTYRQRRLKDRDFPSCRMSPTPCYDSHVCRHRLSPMRSSWCCPSPPPHMPSIPFCLHHGGSSLTGMEIVPYGQECCSDDPSYVSCYCLPAAGHQHVRHCSPCHHFSAPHYGEFSPASPQQSFRNSTQRSQTIGPRGREFSPSPSPLHRQYFSNDVSHLLLPPQSSVKFLEEQWKSPTHSSESNAFQKIRQLENEKKSLMLQVSVLNDQVDAQADKIRELEALAESQKEQLAQMEQNIHQEMMTRSAIENNKLELMTEISSLRLRLTASERDRKDSDEKYRKIQNELQALYDRLAAGGSDSEHSILHCKTIQNGTVIMATDRGTEVEKLRFALETVMASNEEKDKKIEDLRLSLMKYKKLQDYVLAGHQRKASDISLKDGHLCETDNCKDNLSPPSPVNESSKSQAQVKFPGKPPSGHRAPFTCTSVSRCDPLYKESVVSLCGQSAVTSDGRSVRSITSFQKSNSLENVQNTSQKTTSPKSSYGTIPRQSGSQVLQHLQEQLQNIEHGATMPASKTNSTDSTCHSPTLSISSKKQSLKEQGKEVNRGSRNKSLGVSFGKGFFKLRSGKRSSSAPELAPFESVAIAPEEREVSSASPTPQPTVQPFFIKPEKDRNRGVLKFFTRWKRSGSQNIEKIEGDFRRGGIRATAGPRLGWSRDVALNPDIPFAQWNNDIIVEWLHKIGLNMYMNDCRKWKCNGEQLLSASPSEIEKELNIRNPLHKKKFMLCLQAFKSDGLPVSINNMDYQWVVRWLDDIGLPQYKDSFTEARIDGRVLHYLTVDDLLNLKVTNQLHHISIKRGIQVLREKNFDPHCLIRRSVPDEGKNYTPENVVLWTNHRVMEWLRTVDLSEYAPNLRGSGVHGALIVYEPKFNTDLFATLLNIPPTKTLLRRHLATHFKTIVGNDFSQAKRDIETDQPLTPNIKIKGNRKPQFVLKKRKSKGDGDIEEFVCPMDIPVGTTTTNPNGEKLIVRRNSDPTCHESRLLDEKENKATVEIGAVSKEITSLTDQLQEEKLLKSAPTTNV